MIVVYEPYWVEVNSEFVYQRTIFHTPSNLAQSTYFYVTGIGHFICRNDYYLKRKDYNCFLIKYTLEGGGVLYYRGKQYTLQKDQVILIDCTDFHEYRPAKGEIWENKWVHFSGGLCREYFNQIYNNYGPVIDMKKDNLIIRHIDTLLDWKEKEESKFEIKASLLILDMLTEILLAASDKPEQADKFATRDYLAKALEFVQQNYADQISISDICNEVNISLYHFTRIFRRDMGFTPHEYLVKYRINKAKTLLTHTQLPIEDISMQVGFQDASAFIRTFKRLENITPMNYRKIML